MLTEVQFHCFDIDIQLSLHRLWKRLFFPLESAGWSWLSPFEGKEEFPAIALPLPTFDHGALKVCAGWKVYFLILFSFFSCITAELSISTAGPEQTKRGGKVKIPLCHWQKEPTAGLFQQCDLYLLRSQVTTNLLPGFCGADLVLKSSSHAAPWTLSPRSRYIKRALWLRCHREDAVLLGKCVSCLVLQGR